MKVRYKKQLGNFTLDVNFDLPDQGVSVLFGPSGGGKSSLLNLIAGLDSEADIAQFKLKQTVYDDTESKTRLKPWQRKVAYVFQDHRLFPHITVRENILFGYKRRNEGQSVDQVVETFKISELLNHYPQHLSGGQKQRVAMARALLYSPDLLILDEPLAALDYNARQEIIPFIECIPEQLSIPIIYVSHDIKEVLRLADYIVVIDQGKIIETGDIAALCVNQPLLTRQEGASFILEGEVIKIIEDDGLLQVKCDQTDIYFSDHSAGKNVKPKQRLRILIHAKDVSLCLSPPTDSSILNCVPVEIIKFEADIKGGLRVSASLGEQKVVAAISRRSARLLNLAPGKKMYAQFKATAIIK
ncbi:Molybdenum ABC transporter ATP-binding protein ModC [hydrothermal vent metagenome]|uniref:Molybdenum ABC transporter ATP-binding protein ModC n=1 Tax=hydrothermal vent metagenome TaxID=652676 RepID=A0A3B0WPC0_9ZZZZ